MTRQTVPASSRSRHGAAFLVLIGDQRLAAAIGAALRSRLHSGGRPAVVLTPRMSGVDLRDPQACDRLRAWWDAQQTGVDLNDAVVVALDDDELSRLGRDGFPGPRPHGGAPVDGPVGTVAELADAVAAYALAANLPESPAFADADPAGRPRLTAAPAKDKPRRLGFSPALLVTGSLVAGGWMLSAALAPSSAQAATLPGHAHGVHTHSAASREQARRAEARRQEARRQEARRQSLRQVGFAINLTRARYEAAREHPEVRRTVRAAPAHHHSAAPHYIVVTPRRPVHLSRSQFLALPVELASASRFPWSEELQAHLQPRTAPPVRVRYAAKPRQQQLGSPSTALPTAGAGPVIVASSAGSAGPAGDVAPGSELLGGSTDGSGQDNPDSGTQNTGNAGFYPIPGWASPLVSSGGMQSEPVVVSAEGSNDVNGPLSPEDAVLSAGDAESAPPGAVGPTDNDNPPPPPSDAAAAAGDPDEEPSASGSDEPSWRQWIQWRDPLTGEVSTPPPGPASGAVDTGNPRYAKPSELPATSKDALSPSEFNSNESLGGALRRGADPVGTIAGEIRDVWLPPGAHLGTPDLSHFGHWLAFSAEAGKKYVVDPAKKLIEPKINELKAQYQARKAQNLLADLEKYSTGVNPLPSQFGGPGGFSADGATPVSEIPGSHPVYPTRAPRVDPHPRDVDPDAANRKAPLTDEQLAKRLDMGRNLGINPVETRNDKNSIGQFGTGRPGDEGSRADTSRPTSNVKPSATARELNAEDVKNYDGQLPGDRYSIGPFGGASGENGDGTGGITGPQDRTGPTTGPSGGAAGMEGEPRQGVTPGEGGPLGGAVGGEGNLPQGPAGQPGGVAPGGTEPTSPAGEPTPPPGDGDGGNSIGDYIKDGKFLAGAGKALGVGGKALEKLAGPEAQAVLPAVGGYLEGGWEAVKNFDLLRPNGMTNDQWETYKQSALSGVPYVPPAVDTSPIPPARSAEQQRQDAELFGSRVGHGALDGLRQGAGLDGLPPDGQAPASAGSWEPQPMMPTGPGGALEPMPQAISDELPAGTPVNIPGDQTAVADGHGGFIDMPSAQDLQDIQAQQAQQDLHDIDTLNQNPGALQGLSGMLGLSDPAAGDTGPSLSPTLPSNSGPFSPEDPMSALNGMPQSGGMFPGGFGDLPGSADSVPTSGTALGDGTADLGSGPGVPGGVDGIPGLNDPNWGTGTSADPAANADGSMDMAPGDYGSLPSDYLGDASDPAANADGSMDMAPSDYGSEGSDYVDGSMGSDPAANADGSMDMAPSDYGSESSDYSDGSDPAANADGSMDMAPDDYGSGESDYSDGSDPAANADGSMDMAPDDYGSEESDYSDGSAGSDESADSGDSSDPAANADGSMDMAPDDYGSEESDYSDGSAESDDSGSDESADSGDSSDPAANADGSMDMAPDDYGSEESDYSDSSAESDDDSGSDESADSGEYSGSDESAESDDSGSDESAESDDSGSDESAESDDSGSDESVDSEDDSGSDESADSEDDSGSDESADSEDDSGSDESADSEDDSGSDESADSDDSGSDDSGDSADDGGSDDGGDSGD